MEKIKRYVNQRFIDVDLPTSKALDVIDQFPDKADPEGSYTGKPMDLGSKPVQDADDL